MIVTMMEEAVQSGIILAKDLCVVEFMSPIGTYIIDKLLQHR